MKTYYPAPLMYVFRRKIITILILLFSSSIFGQLSGIKTIPGDYATISAAVAALNGSGAGAGGVVFNIAANYTETIAATLSVTATGTSANPIIFQKDPATPGANPLITAYTGGTGTPATALQDGIWRFVGSDYVTIDGINIEDNVANSTNPSTMEYGYAFYKASTSNGCQYNTIKNCTITLNTINNAAGIAPMVDGSTGILLINALPASAASGVTPVSEGTNSNNKIYNNTILNTNTGIALIGYAAPSPFTLADFNNDVGGNAPATGNRILNYGGAVLAANPAVAIRTTAQQALNVSYNTINNNNGNGTNHRNALRGIFTNTATSANTTVTYNTITINGGDSIAVITAIENTAGSTAAGNTIDISNNTIINGTYNTATRGGFQGIYNNGGSPSVLQITRNTISNNSSAATGTGFFYGIINSGVAQTVNINRNSVSGNSTAALTTGLFLGIYNSAAAPVLKITGNTVAGNTSSALSGLCYAIYNNGTVTATINIDSNNIGTPIVPAINFTAANSGSQVFIYNRKGGTAANLSVSDNNFYNVLYSVTGTGANTYILNAAVTLSQAINNNRFNNLNVNTIGNLTLISNSVGLTATGVRNVNGNSISGSLSKSAGGTVTLFVSSATSVSGSVINYRNNNFSNISVTGATVIAGWTSTDAGSFNKTIENNTFSNWSGGTGAITALNVNSVGTTNATRLNLINNISGASTVTGIVTSSGNDNIFSNTVYALSSSGASSVAGISVTGGTKKSIYRNKIFDMATSHATGSVYGISVSGSTSAVIQANIYNNLIANLRAPAANAADAVRGISVTSTRANSAINVYYNTVYINAVSAGTTFGSSGIYHTASTIATTAQLDLRNNIIINTSTPNGTGITAAYRRSTTSLTNYASTSDNNLFYAGAGGANRVLFWQSASGTDQTLIAYKARVAPRDALSVTEDLISTSKFLSTNGSSPLFLHLDSSKESQAESGAAVIAGFEDDYDLEFRNGSAGYTGTGTAPDIGADEFEGRILSGLSGTYAVGAGQIYTSLTNTGGLFSAINTLGLSSSIQINITSDLTEDGSNSLFQWAEQGSGNYTVTIQPNDSVAKIISGNILAGLIRLNGASRVTIDGRFNGSGNHLTFRNTNTAGTTATAVTFINGANNNTIRNSIMEAVTNVSNGVVLFSTSTGAVGNSNNTISNCTISATVGSNTGIQALYSAGTTGKENSANEISNNNIINYRERGLSITATGSTGWAINNNSFYNGSVTGSVNFTAASALHGIRILGGTGYAVLNNYIGGNATLASGTNAVYLSTTGVITYQGILLTTSAATPVSSIQGNTIRRISLSAVPTSTTSANVFTGIETNGSGINIGGSLAGEGNIIGSNTVNGSVLVTTTTSSTTFKSGIRGIACSSSEGVIAGNQVSGIDISNVGSAPSASSFIGIYINSITAPSQVKSNIVGSTGSGAVLNSIRVLAASTSTSTTLTGISIGTALTSAILVDGNTIQNMSHQSTTSSGTFTGILNSATAPATVTIESNTLLNNTLSATAGTFYGIYNTFVSPSTLTITNNTISTNASSSTGTGAMYCIYTLGASPLVTISNNIISGNSSAALTTGLFTGIYNAATPATLDINGNSIYGSTSTASSGVYYPIYNTGVVTTTLNINSNSIGSALSPAITFSAANSGNQISIINAAGAPTASLSISNNSFYNVLYSTGGSGTTTLISNTAATLSQAINSNTFYNLNVNTSGNIAFISNNVIVPATGTQNVNNNAISGTFIKSGSGGTLTLFNSSAASASGSTINNNSNNFSNITVSGSTVIDGWTNTDAGASSKTIQANIFNNWTADSGAVNVLSVNITAPDNAVTGNIISNITGRGTITGITTGAGNDNIYLNTINTLSSTGAVPVTGISVTAGTAKRIFKNKIYDLQANNSSGTVNGVLVSGSTITQATIYNNLIGDLKAPAANAVTDAIRGISIIATSPNSTINVYYNTVFINAISSGASFGSSGIYHAASATASTATLDLRNNSITNTSTPKGSGLTVAFTRSAATLNNYASGSNNNLFYAGTPGPSRLIFNDGTAGAQSLAGFKQRVTPQDDLSVSEDLTAKFLSTAGPSSVFLHMNATVPSFVEAGAANIPGFTDDFDGQIRAGNPGYIGRSSSPDIGADEIFGIETTPPVIEYTLLSDTVSSLSRTVTGVEITDGSGVSVAPGTRPRIYYKRFSDANVWLDNTPSTNGWKFTEALNTKSPFTFTINYALLYNGAAVTAGLIQYFIVAQDDATVSNTAINSGIFTAVPPGVALTSSAFPITGTINSYKIPFAGIYNVGNSEVYTSLTKADGLFAAINAAGLTGNMTIRVTSNLTEDGLNPLLEWPEQGAGNYTLTMQSDGPTTRNITGNAPLGLIRFNGADRVTVDGRSGGTGNRLYFANTNTSGTTGTAFSFINGATGNSIKYSNINAYANEFNGTILFGTSDAASGNSNNTIDNCTVSATVSSNTGAVAIYSGGTVGKENASNVISSTDLINYRDRALDITAEGSTGWSITGNNMYNGNVTGSVSYAAGTALHGIRILGGNGYSLLNNFIGGSTSRASGVNALYASGSGNISYQGILLTTSGPIPASYIRGNTISAISVSGKPTTPDAMVFTGIETNGAGITTGGNTRALGNIIGSGEINGSIVILTSTTSSANTSVITGISHKSSGGTLNNNLVGGFNISNTGTAPASSVMRGIFFNNATAPSEVNNNLIGSTAISNSIQFLPTSASATSSLTGISIGTAVTTAVVVNANRIENISNLSTVSSGSFTGIYNAALPATITINSDTIQYINSAANSASGSTLFSGIISGSASVITNNLINNIRLASNGLNAQVAGISVSGQYANTISGNILSNLSTASTKNTAVPESGTPAGSAVIGILNTATAGNQVISSNTLSGLSVTSSAPANAMITGIGITATGTGRIFNNRIVTLTNTSTGTAPSICGIVAANGNFIVYNNSVRLGNAANTNGLKLYGIIHTAGTGGNYLHNSVRISGSSTGTSQRSAAFIATAGNLTIKNNIFVNIRTGNGFNYAISNIASPVSLWAASASDYNNIFSSNANTTGEWGNTVSRSFDQWKLSSGGDLHSVTKPVSFITSDFDLQPDSSTNCTLDNAGIPLTAPLTVTTDISNVVRNTVSPDLGAYEFRYSAFTVIAESDSPVCAGDSLTLNVNSGSALSPAFRWNNPQNTVISTIRNPTVALAAGYYKVTVTDQNGCSVTDSTMVSINQRPTARISAVSSVCDTGFVNLNITVTGTGTVSGTLSNGETFSGTGPLIVVPVYVSATTVFSISELNTSSCSAIATDIPDSVTITVTAPGEWIGITRNWNDPVNWCGGTLPTSLTNVAIHEGTPFMPLITDSAFCKNLTINSGDTLTIASGGTLSIAGTLSNYGGYLDNGTTLFNGTSGLQTFTGINEFNNLTLKNSSSLLVPAVITIKNTLTISAGTLNANNFNIAVRGNWINNVSSTAFNAGTATVTFNGTTPQFIGGTAATTFNNINIADSGSTVSLQVNALIGNTLSVTSGTFDLGAFTANRTTSGGILTVANNATLKIGGTNTFPANYTTNTLVVAGTVEYSGTNQTVAMLPYGNLTLSSSLGAVIKTLPAVGLTVLGNLTSIKGNGTSVSFNATSPIYVGRNVSIGASTTFNGSSFTHTITGNWYNTGNFNGGTGTVIFNGSGTVVSGSGNNFNNLTVAASAVDFSSGLIQLTGNLLTTGSGSFIQAAGGTMLMSGTGKNISGTGIKIGNLTVSGSVSTAATFELTGNLAVSGNFTATGGTLTMSGSAKSISGTGSINLFVLAPLGVISSDNNFSIVSGLTVFGSFSSSAGTITFTDSSFLSGTANMYNVSINGASLHLSAGSVLGVANVFSIISGTLDVSSSGPNTVNFNGPGIQNINGIRYSHLVLSNGGTKTAAGPITTAYDITTGTGTTFNPSSFTHTIYGNWINNGIFVTGSSVIQLLGPANGFISGATTFNTLIINTSNAETEIVLQSNITAATVNMINGKMLTGANTLTITATRNGNGIILGRIRRMHVFTTGVAYAFEGPENTITFSAVASVSSITVSIAKGSIADFPFSGSISRVYDILVPAGTYTATLRLHYEDIELNGNDESSMNIWQHNGTSWAGTGKTGNSTTANYVEQSGLTNINSRWTASDNSNLVQWNGSVSSDWNNAANWTVLEGVGSRPPSANDIVDIGSSVFNYQPVITSSVTVKSIIFGSAKPVILSVGSSGSLTTLGDINGEWTGNARHTININNQTLTVNGTLELSDGTNGHAIDLVAGSGTITTLGSLVETGGANVTFTAAGALNIYDDFVYSSGNFTAGSGTVTYMGTENQDIAHVRYNDLIINKAAGLASINDTVMIAGSLFISSGELVNFSSTTISVNTTIGTGATLNNYGVLHVRGNWNNNGTFTSNGSSVYFDGTGNQSISASTFHIIYITKPSGTAYLTGNVVITGEWHLLSGTLDLQTFDFNRNVPGGGATTHAAGATLMMGANNGPRGFSNNILDPASITIVYGSAPQYFGLANIALGHLILRGTGLKVILEPMSVNDLTIDSLATVEAGSSNLTLHGNWINKGTFIPSTSTVSLIGTSKTITGNTTFNKLTVSGSYNLLSDVTFNDLLTVTSTGIFTAGPSIFSTVNGDFTNYGVLYSTGTTTFTGTKLQTLSLINSVQTVAVRVNFNGSVSPILNSTSVPEFGFLNINNTGGINPSVGYTVAFSLNVAAGAAFNGGSSTHNLYGSVNNNGAITSSGTLNFSPTSASTVNLGSKFSSSGTIVLGGAGAMTLTGSMDSLHNVIVSNTNPAGVTALSGWNIENNLTITSGALLNAGTYAYTVGGNILNNGTLNPGSSLFTLNGTGTQDITSLSPFNNLTVSKTSGSAALSSNTTINGELKFTGGKIDTRGYLLHQPSSGTVTGAAQNTGWVNGKLQKNITTGSGSKGFEVGDSTNYTPVNVAFTDVSASGNLTASATAGDHPNISSSLINPARSVNRFYTLSSDGIALSKYDASFNYISTDIDSGADTSLFGIGLFNGSSWSLPVTASRFATGIRAGGITEFGQFAIGEVCNAGTTISYPDSPYCINSGTAIVTRTGNTTGVFTSTAGLSVDSLTGAIDLTSALPGTYRITYTIQATGGCNLYATSADITIPPALSATISYEGSPYCSNAGTANVTLSGTTGGKFSSTPGLTINSATGDIDLDSSSAGTYVVTYTLAATGGCAQYQDTANITINDPSSNTISYPGTSYCSTAGIVAVTQTGVAGGVYGAAPGLSINRVTGAINTAISNADTYVVTYLVPAAYGCDPYTISTMVTITAAPSASISYNGSPYCNVPGTASVTLIGTENGNFSSSPGLVINNLTGDINTGASTPGNYIVTYTVDAAGGCGRYTTTTRISIAVTGTWTGSVSNDWNTAANWQCNLIPAYATHVIIPAGLTNYPVISTGIVSVNNLTISTGASLTVREARLQISGSILNSGTFNTIDAILEMNGSSPQTIPGGAFAGNTLRSLTINNIAGVTLVGALNLTGVLSILTGSLASNGYLTLKSSATTSAIIAPVTSLAPDPLIGNVTVERYIPGRRKYRLITSSVTTSAATTLSPGQEASSIWGNWQNQGNNLTPNSGTLITGGLFSDGFDQQTQNNSLFTYDPFNRRFIGFNSAGGKNTKYTPLKAGSAYYIFVYGDRTNSVTTSAPNNTVLRATGKIVSGTQVFDTGSPIPLSNVTGNYTLLGNPFVSPIDWSAIQRTGLSDTYWGWDPNLSSTGGYVTVSTLGSTILIAPFSGTTGLNQYIQPGQGFFVRTSAPSPVLTIREQDKAGNFNASAFRRSNASGREADVISIDDRPASTARQANTVPLIAVNLLYQTAGTTLLADGVVAAFAPEYNNQVGREDAFKMTNNTESIAIANRSDLLSIDGRQMPQGSDTLFLQLSRLTRPEYILQIFTQQLEGMQVTPFLQDNYLNTVMPLMINDTNRIVFTIAPATPASSDPNRFRIVFGGQPVLPVNFISLKAAAKDQNVQVDWSVSAESGIERYEVERSTDRGNFVKAGEVKARINQGAGSYRFIDSNATSGVIFYRIRYFHPDGRYFYSKTISVTIDVPQKGIEVYPVPVKNHQINIRLNRIEKGKYTLVIFNAEGRRVDERVIDHNGHSSQYGMRLNHQLPQGTYHLLLLKDKIQYSRSIYLE